MKLHDGWGKMPEMEATYFHFKYKTYHTYEKGRASLPSQVGDLPSFKVVERCSGYADGAQGRYPIPIGASVCINLKR